jgi:hypothetical protein
VFTKSDIARNKGNVLYRYAPPNHVDAGMHATITGSLALQLYKYLSVAEGGIGPDKPFEFLQVQQQRVLYFFFFVVTVF